MNDYERRIRDAFNSVPLPDQLNERTLAHIETQRYSHQTQANSPTRAVSAKRRVHKLPIAFAAAACLALAAIGLHLGATDKPTAYIAIDINPSIELEVNETDIVVGIRGLNDDGVNVVVNLENEGLEINGTPIENALATITGSSALSPYLTDDSFIALSVFCENEDQRQRLLTAGNLHLATLPCEGLCGFTTEEEREAASAAGVGSQRFHAAQYLASIDPSLTLEECLAMSMRELRERTVELTGSAYSAQDSNAQNQSQGQGQGQGVGIGAGSGNGKGAGDGNSNSRGPRSE